MRVLLIVFITASFAVAQTKAQTKDCTAEGTVVNALTGHPIPHAQVVAAPDKGASTDASGKWRIAGLPCTATRFTVNHAGFLEATEGPGLIRLTPEAAIFGKVLDGAGDPISGAEVQFFDTVVYKGRRVMSGSVSINANKAGEYRIGLLLPGRYMVCARTSQVTYPVGGGGPVPYGETCNPALHMTAGQELHEDLHLPAVPGVHVRGTVTGAPEGARIVVQMARASQIAHDNKFDFAGVVPGSYAIEGLAVLDGASRFAAATVDVGPSDADGVALMFAPSVDVTGAVRFSGGKRPEDLKLYLSLVPSDPGSFAGLPEWDATGSSFTWSAIPPGKYRVNANLPPDPNYIKSVSLQGRDIRGEELIVTTSTGPIEIDIGDDGGTLEGSVTDADGKPVPAQIMLIRAALPPQTIRGDENGRFTMTSIAPGDYLAYAFDDTRNVEYAEPAWMRLNAGAGVPVSIAPGSSNTVSLVRITVPK